MKEFVSKVAFFLLTTIFLYPIFIFLFGNFVPHVFAPNLKYNKGGYGHLYTRLQEVENLTTEKTDILFLGSSLAYRGFDPRFYEDFTTFNLGSSSQTPIQTKILLDRYWEKIAPRIVIYEVNPIMFESDGVESSIDVISNAKIKQDLITMALAVNHIKVYNTLIFSFMKNIFSDGNQYKEEVKKGQDFYVSGGYVEREVEFFAKQKQSIRCEDKMWRPQVKQIKAFNDIIDFFKDKQVKLIMVSNPVTSEGYGKYKYGNDDFLAIVSKHKDVCYLDFNHLLELNDSLHFYDALHLNQNGVRIVNQELLKIVNMVNSF